MQNCSHFFNVRCFLKLFFAWNKYNVRVESFLVCFLGFYFLIHTVENKTENPPHRYEVRKFRTTVELLLKGHAMFFSLNFTLFSL